MTDQDKIIAFDKGWEEGYHAGVEAALNIVETKVNMWGGLRSLKMTYYSNAAKELAKLIKGLINNRYS